MMMMKSGFQFVVPERERETPRRILSLVRSYDLPTLYPGLEAMEVLQILFTKPKTRCLGRSVGGSGGIFGVSKLAIDCLGKVSPFRRMVIKFMIGSGEARILRNAAI